MQIIKNATPSEMPTPAAPRTWSFWKTFWLGFAVVFLATMLFATAAVAKTGLVRIPGMSSIVATTAEPARRVAIPAGTPTVQQTLQTQLEGAVARFGRLPSEENRRFEIRLSESSFTKSLQSYRADIEKQFPGSTLEDVQLSVDERWLEVFLRLRRGDNVNTLRIRFVMDIENGAPKVTFKEIRLGSLPIPAGLAGGLLAKSLDASLKQFAADIANIGTLTEVELRPGIFVARGVLATGVLNPR